MQMGIQFTHTKTQNDSKKEKVGGWKKSISQLNWNRISQGVFLCVCHTTRTAIYHYAKEHRAWGRVSSFGEVYFPFSDWEAMLEESPPTNILLL